MHYYLDKVHNLHAFSDDNLSVSREHAFAATKERLREDIYTFLSQNIMPVRHGQFARLVRMAKLLLEYYSYNIAFD